MTKLAHELVVAYPENHTSCLEFINDLTETFYLGDNSLNFQEIMSAFNDFGGMDELPIYMNWFTQSIDLLCKQTKKYDLENVIFDSFKLQKLNYDNEINWYFFSILIKGTVMYYMILALLFYLFPKVPFGLYVFLVTLTPNSKHLIQKQCGCLFKKLFVEIYKAKEEENVKNIRKKKIVRRRRMRR